MREIGGYIELEQYTQPMLHENAIALNCGRNALAYLIEAKFIKKISMPYFMCTSCDKVFKQYNVSVNYYHINSDFLPIHMQLEEDEWVYIVNFYGQITNECLKKLQERYVRIIVDNTQSYFQMPLAGVDTLYSCRKYFGVADGAFLYTDKHLQRELSKDVSLERMHFLLGRYEKTASEFYLEYVANNELFEEEPIKYMSKLTTNLLHGIDYNQAAKQRTDNFRYLHDVFKNINALKLTIPYGPFMYPLYIENSTELRINLQKQKIYIPILWPNILDSCSQDTLEYKYAANILPLPIDQRYGIEDMKCMEKIIRRMLVGVSTL